MGRRAHRLAGLPSLQFMPKVDECAVQTLRKRGCRAWDSACSCTSSCTACCRSARGEEAKQRAQPRCGSCLNVPPVQHKPESTPSSPPCQPPPSVGCSASAISTSASAEADASAFPSAPAARPAIVPLPSGCACCRTQPALWSSSSRQMGSSSVPAARPAPAAAAADSRRRLSSWGCTCACMR